MNAFTSEILHASTEDEAIERLHRERRTDGLPIVLPTPARVEAMLLHASSLDGDLVIGRVEPAGRQLTIEAAAVNAVMAGCTAEMFPLVIAACEALVDPIFDVGPSQNTTHCVTPLIIVNGPARDLYGVHCDTGALGPGYRVNATLGRAIRLIMMNVGGGVSGIGDMSTLGTPAKFTCCLGENEEMSPFPPLHVSLGFDRADSTVTMLGVEGPHSLLFNVGDMEREGDLFLQVLAAGLRNPATNNIYCGKGNLAVILNPVHAQLLHRSGFTRQSAQERIFELAVDSCANLRKIAPVNVGTLPREGDALRIVKKPEDILILTGGAHGGAYSAYFPTWGAGENGNNAVTKRVRIDEGCEIVPSQRG